MQGVKRLPRKEKTSYKPEEYELKIARRDIEHTSKIVYQLEMLECFKIIIYWELQRRTKTTTSKEDAISAFC
jgi:hypothetical protein